MTDPTKPAQPALTPKLEKIRGDLDRLLRDYNLSQQEYNSLIDDMKRHRKHIEGEGDSIFDDLSDE